MQRSTFHQIIFSQMHNCTLSRSHNADVAFMTKHDIQAKKPGDVTLETSRLNYYTNTHFPDMNQDLQDSLAPSSLP